MKTLKRFALTLLSVIMLLTLTACGGSGSAAGNTENQLTSKINEKLSGTGIQVTYDSKLNEKLVVCLDIYRTSNNEDKALEAAGLDNEHYALYVSTANSTVNDAAAVLAGQIRAEKTSSGRVAQKIGYASAELVTGNSAIFALVQF